MPFIVAVALLLSSNLLLSEAKADHLDYLSEYIASLMEHQVILKPTKQFNIWINWLAPTLAFETTISKILSKPSMQCIPRVLLNISAVHWDVASDTYSIIFINLNDIPHLNYEYMRANIIALGVFHRCDQLSNVAEYFFMQQVINVVYFSTNVKLMCFNRHYLKRFERFRVFPPPSSLFPDQTGNLGGHTIVASAITGPELKRTNGGDLIGPEASWIRETARRINASTKFFSTDCRGVLNDCIARITHYQGEVVDIMLNRFIMFRSGGFDSVEPLSHLIYVPRGRFLSQFEVFVAPFDHLVWLILGLLAVVFKIVEILFPKHLRRSFTLLTFSGFLDFTKLRKLSRTEFFSSFIVTVVMFFLFRAYETIIISMMINTPRHSSVNNLQQLIDARIHVKVDYRTITESYGLESSLEPLITHDHEHLTKPMDQLSAYFLSSDLAETLVSDPKNVDPATREPRYLPLDERYSMNIGVYTIGIFTLYDRLKFTQRMLFEAGIRQFWRRNFRDEQYTWLKEEVVLNDSLKFGNILPVWIVLGIGLGYSTVIFVGELLLQLWRNRTSARLEHLKILQKIKLAINRRNKKGNHQCNKT